MKDQTCENVLIAMMAAADGESAPLSPDEIEAHLVSCANCREEAVRTQQVDVLFRQVIRRESTIDLWPMIESRLDRRRRRWQPYALVSVLLLAYKLYEMVPEAEPGWAIHLVPLIIFGALLVFLRENPFKINTNLVLEK